jgi:hypothetical protein
MKSIRILIVFVLFAVAVVACLWIGGFIGGDVAMDAMGKTVGIVAVIGGVLAGTFVLLKTPKNPNDSSNSGPGPKF